MDLVFISMEDENMCTKKVHCVFQVCATPTPAARPADVKYDNLNCLLDSHRYNNILENSWYP